MWEQLDRDLVEMGMFEKPGESMDSLAENMILLKRYSYPEDIVGTASFLASSESDYMTGQFSRSTAEWSFTDLLDRPGVGRTPPGMTFRSSKSGDRTCGEEMRPQR